MVTNTALMILMMSFIAILWYTNEFFKRKISELEFAEKLGIPNQLDIPFIFVSFLTLFWFTYLIIQDDATTRNTILSSWNTTMIGLSAPLILFFLVVFIYDALKYFKMIKLANTKGEQHTDENNT